MANLCSNRRTRLVLFVLGCTCWFGMLHEGFNEYIEHKWIKHGSSFHNWMHTSKQGVIVPLQDDLIVFVHVPRTSGETLKIALFNDVDYQYDPVWTDSVTEYPSKTISKKQRDKWFNDEVMTPPRPWPVGFEWPSHTVRRPWKGLNGSRGTANIHRVLQNASVVQGFWSKQDIQRLRAMVAPRKLKLWTVLREPLERALSKYAQHTPMFSPGQQGSCRVPWSEACSAGCYNHGTCEARSHLASPFRYYSHPPLTRKSFGSQINGHMTDLVVSFGHNAMTWQVAQVGFVC